MGRIVLFVSSFEARRRRLAPQDDAIRVDRLMVTLRGKEIDAFLARPDPGRPIILLYGPDAGMVRERAEALLASAVDDPNDPFSLVRLDGHELSTQPSPPVGEAST